MCNSDVAAWCCCYCYHCCHCCHLHHRRLIVVFECLHCWRSIAVSSDFTIHHCRCCWVAIALAVAIAIAMASPWQWPLPSPLLLSLPLPSPLVDCWFFPSKTAVAITTCSWQAVAKTFGNLCGVVLSIDKTFAWFYFLQSMLINHMINRMINRMIDHIFIARIPYIFLRTFYEQVGSTCKSENNFGHVIASCFLVPGLRLC